MSFIGNESLISLLRTSKTIVPKNEDRIKNGSYELSLGDQVFQTDSKPRTVKTLREGQKIYIKPGQFALLLTEEYLRIPEDKIAFISIKAGIKFKGLVNVSGFHVDPGFEGKLLFSVYNAGPKTIVLSRGTPCFPIWFADIDKRQDYKGIHQDQRIIPNDPIEALSQGELASPNVLSKRIDNNLRETNKRIELIERDQKANNYLRVTSIALFITILVKFAFDWGVFNTGLDRGIAIKQNEIQQDSIINDLLIEKRKLLIENNKLRIENDSIKKQ